jgi:hypothetical protein
VEYRHLFHLSTIRFLTLLIEQMSGCRSLVSIHGTIARSLSTYRLQSTPLRFMQTRPGHCSSSHESSTGKDYCTILLGSCWGHLPHECSPSHCGLIIEGSTLELMPIVMMVCIRQTIKLFSKISVLSQDYP